MRALPMRADHPAQSCDAQPAKAPSGWRPLRPAVVNGDARRQLEAAELKYLRLVENIPEIVWAAEDGHPSFVSANVERITGFSAAEILDAPLQTWIARTHPDDLERVQSGFERLVWGREAFEAEYRWQRKDGSWIWVRGRAVIRPGGDSEVIEGFCSDITAQKLLEQEVRQLQRVEAIGQFGAGIAHDFNNLLAVILANDRFLLDGLAADDPRRVDAEAIFEATERAVSLTRQLLNFSRPHSCDSTVIDLNQIVAATESLLRHVIREDIHLSILPSPTSCHVLADAGQVEQVVVNLVVNARDAMPQGGTLSIQTSVVDLTGARISTELPALHGSFVVLAVSDTGVGMDADTRRRVFEPFFTTKANGTGTGLGLSTCARIVKEIGGYICADGELGHGSVFKVYLPHVDCGPETASISVAHGADRLAGTETILVVEDDERVLSLVQRTLTRHDYRVMVASSGQQALTIAHSHDGVIDLVLSDVVIPDISGTRIVAHVQSLSPATRALFMSGHTQTTLAGMLDSTANFIAKPFTPDVLARKVREVLDA